MSIKTTITAECTRDNQHEMFIEALMSMLRNLDAVPQYKIAVKHEVALDKELAGLPGCDLAGSIQEIQQTFLPEMAGTPMDEVLRRVK